MLLNMLRISSSVNARASPLTVISTTFAPYRPARSATRAPHTPLLPTNTVSPGSTRFAMQASMPEWPVPLMQSVYLVSV